MHPPQLSIVHIHYMRMPQYMYKERSQCVMCHVYKFGHTALETIVFGGSSKYLLQTVSGCTNLLLTVPVGTQS